MRIQDILKFSRNRHSSLAARWHSWDLSESMMLQADPESNAGVSENNGVYPEP